MPAIFLGDYFDDFDDRVEYMKATCRWLKEALETVMTNFFGAITALLMCPMNSACVGAFVRDAELTSSKCFMSAFRRLAVGSRFMADIMPALAHKPCGLWCAKTERACSISLLDA